MAQGIVKNVDITARQVYTIEVKICDSRTATLECVAYPVFDKPFSARGFESPFGKDGTIRINTGAGEFYVYEFNHQPGAALDCYATETFFRDYRIGVQYQQQAQSLLVTPAGGSDGTYLVTIPYGVTFNPDNKEDEAAYQKSLWTVGDQNWCPQPRRYAYNVMAIISGSTTREYLVEGYINMSIKPTGEKPTTLPTACSIKAL